MTSTALTVLALWITATRCVAMNATCDERYIRITPEHTMCKSWNEECHFPRKGGYMFKKTLLRTHNMIRNSIRRYVGKQYPLATNMKFMYWDEELYAMARMHSLQCVDEPDCNLCHQIGDFPVEQNFAVKTLKLSEVAGTSPVRRFRTVIKEWAAELGLYDRNVVKRFLFKEGLPTHWTNILRAKTTFLGCASTNFIEDDPNTLKEVYICNYGPANLTEGEEIYKTGKKPCSECEGDVGCDLEFKRLCSNLEEVKVTETYPQLRTEIFDMTEVIEEEGGGGTKIYPEEETEIVKMTVVPSEAEEVYSGIGNSSPPAVATFWPQRRKREFNSNKIHRRSENTSGKKKAFAKPITHLRRKLPLEKLLRRSSKASKSLPRKSAK